MEDVNNPSHIVGALSNNQVASAASLVFGKERS
jgi:hypothetical protein